MRLPSVMKHGFSQVPSADIQRSTFNRSHGLKTTMYGDGLVPIFVDEALPGDTFNLKQSHFARLSTPLRPLMDNMYFETFYFAVPLRLVWDNFKKFMGEQNNPGDSTDYLIPQVEAPAVTGWTENGIADYMSIPTGVAGLQHSSLFHRAYHLIYNEWFRDQNLQNSLTISKGDGPDTVWLGFDGIRNRNKKHDYFTSCLPWPQKGTAVEIPISGNIDILRESNAPVWKVYGAGTNTLMAAAQDALINTGNIYGSVAGDLSFDPNGGLYGDLSTATNATINNLRTAFQLQKLFERDARGGTRYTEIIKAHFGVTSSDARLQRPEYLGGTSSNFNINPIAQTSETTVDSPQGNLSAMGTTSGINHGFIKSFEEHSIIIGLANIRADITYQQGLNRMFSRRSKYDFYWPALAHIGEQAVLNKELYCDGSSNDDNTFGYQERYAEYRYKPSVITGEMRSNAAATLDSWHLSEEYGALPTLGSIWIQSLTPWSRVLATGATAPVLILDMYYDLKCTRPMPAFSVPGLVDHF